MTRFETATPRGAYWAIALSIAVVFVVDLQTPIGVATWMLYLIPMLLCFFVWQPRVPLEVAGVSTLLLVIDYFVSAPGIPPSIALGNRAMGLFVIWAAALQAWRIINSRLAVRTQAENLQAQQTELERINGQLEEHAQRLARKNAELAEAKRDVDRKAEALTRANQYKSEFLANMSHELRTPLNTAMILSKLLADNRQENLTPEQVKFARSIYSAGNDLLELINDSLDFSKLEARKVEICNEPIALETLADGLTQTFRPLAEQRRIGFSVELTPGLPTVVESDSQRLRQVLKNLLSNAVKFTERGRVALTVSAIGEHIEFAVRDTGIGIAPEHHDLIFEPFRQADGTNRRFGGTGLGLSISRELAELLGGHIELQSAPGQGSTFRLLVPQVPPAALAMRVAN